MRYFYPIIGILLILLSYGCKNLQLSHSSAKEVNQKMELGSIVIQEKSWLDHQATTVALPKYNQKLKLGFNVVEFNERSFREYQEVSPQNQAKISYVDSLKQKPRFIELYIVDKVSLLSEINASYNKEVLNYLEVQPKAKILTKLSMAFSNYILGEIEMANALFFVNNKYKEYSLEIHQKGNIIKQVSLANGVSFAFENSGFCWGENERRDIVIKQISGNKDKCAKGYENSAIKAENEKDVFKF